MCAALLCGCLQDADSDRIPVRYTVLVRDGVTGAALAGAEVELTGEDTVSRALETNDNGRVIFPSVESYVNQIIVSKDGYVPADTVDVVTVADSSASVILRTMNLSLLPQGYDGSDTGRVFTYTVTVLNVNTRAAVSGASVSVTSGGAGFGPVKTDSNGRVSLDSLPSRQNLFSIDASGYISLDTLVVADTANSSGVVLQTLKILLSPSAAE